VPLRPPDWEWSLATDGALALDQNGLWDEPEGRRPLTGSRTARLKAVEPSDTVPAMPAGGANIRRPRAARRQAERERRRRRLALLVALVVVLGVVVMLSAFGGSATPSSAAAPASAARLVPAGPPQPEIVSRVGGLHLQLPISQSRVTAIGYQGGSDGAIAQSPLGTQANQGVLRRVLHSLVGGSNGTPRWYQLPGGVGPDTSSLDVGATAGTDVYSPVDGTIVAIADVILNGRAYGSRIDIQPATTPSLIVSVLHVRVDPSLTVGAPVTSGGSKLGSVVDFSQAEGQALARYTNDAGNHVVVEVHAAAALSLG
jgi:hypothetical protein